MISQELNKVEGFTALRKDSSTGGVVNVDRKAYKARLYEKQIAERRSAEKKIQQQQIKDMESEINSIKDEISDVKEMLLALINKGK